MLMLLRSSENETIHRVAAGAIANLAMNGIFFKLITMNMYQSWLIILLVSAMIFLICATFCVISETNQELIMVLGGIGLLSVTAANAEDPQTLRMVAGAIANLCGNGKIV